MPAVSDVLNSQDTDDGVPPPCRGEVTRKRCAVGDITWWKLLNHNHPLTNDNHCMNHLGSIGFQHFDKRRSNVSSIFVPIPEQLSNLGTTLTSAAAVTTAITIHKIIQETVYGRGDHRNDYHRHQPWPSS